MSTKAMIKRIKGNKNLFENPFTKGKGAATTTPTGSTSTTGKFIIAEFCMPAKVYIILAVISMMYYVSADQKIAWLIVKALAFILWAFFMNKLCTSDASL